MSKSVEELFRDAPEGTTHFGPANGYFVDTWFKIDGSIQEYKCLDDDGDWTIYDGGIPGIRIAMLIECQPQPKPWSGPEDGLPPVDSLVMVHECTHDYTKQFNDQIVRIVAHDQGKYAVFAADNFVYHALVAEKFKLPPTPEQLAAEEREKAAQDMWSSIEYVREKGVFSFLDLMRALHDQGFKREVK